VSYCINPRCDGRENPDEAAQCLTCGTPLLINDRFRLLRPLRPVRLDHATDVFEAVDEKGSWISPPGAIKVLKVLKSRDKKHIELQAREAHCLQMLEHPGIPRVDLDDHFSISVAGMPFPLHCLAMDKIEGKNLEEWLEGHGRISQQLALDWLGQLVQMLDHVHERGFFHRDIKPSNIVLKPDGTLALIDFGGSRQVTDTYLAKISGSGSKVRPSSHDITVVRSTRYSPPEQIDGQAVPQSDFFALGRTLVHLVTGVPLIELPAEAETRKLVWQPKARHIDQPLADFLDELMEPDPAKRPKNTKGLREYLEKRLPRQLKIYQVRQSLPFRVGMILLGALAVVGVCKAYNSAAYYYYFVIGLETQRSSLPGSAQEAQAYFQNALAFNSDSVTAYINLGRAYQDQGKDECALDAYQKAIALDPTSAAAYYNLGDFYDSRNQFAEAEAAFTKAAQYGENQTGGVSNALARINNRQQDYKAALPLAQQGFDLATNPQDQAVALKNLGWAKFGLAETQQQQGQLRQAQTYYQEAQQHLKASIEQDPTRPAAYCLLAQVQEAVGTEASAQDSWRQCLQRNDFLNLPEVKGWRDQVLNRLYDGDTATP